MTERINRHRTLKGLSALGVSALFVASCAGADVNPAASFVATDIPAQGGQPTRTPDRVVVAPEPSIKTEKTPAEQAKEAMFNSWFYTLNSGVQENADGDINGGLSTGGNILKVNATNLSDWQNQKDLILYSGQPSEALQVSWVGGFYAHEKGNNDGRGSKYLGQIEVNNPQIVSEGVFPLSDADTANGISWHERIKINYIERFHSKTFWGQGDYKKLKQWTTIFDNKSLPDFSDWYQTFYEGDVVLKTGKWKIQLSQDSSRRSLMSSIKGFTIPYTPKMEIGAVCANSCTENYEIISIK